jgi:hypothetical protein
MRQSHSALRPATRLCAGWASSTANSYQTAIASGQAEFLNDLGVLRLSRIIGLQIINALNQPSKRQHAHDEQNGYRAGLLANMTTSRGE